MTLYICVCVCARARRTNGHGGGYLGEEVWARDTSVKGGHVERGVVAQHHVPRAVEVVGHHHHVVQVAKEMGRKEGGGGGRRELRKEKLELLNVMQACQSTSESVS